MSLRTGYRVLVYYNTFFREQSPSEAVGHCLSHNAITASKRFFMFNVFPPFHPALLIDIGLLRIESEFFRIYKAAFQKVSTPKSGFSGGFSDFFKFCEAREKSCFP